MSGDTPFDEWKKDRPEFIGWSRGDSEAEVIAGVSEALAIELKDGIARLKRIAWTIGAGLEIAVARKYAERLGIKGWIATHLKCSHQHAYSCRESWRLEQQGHDFDAPVEWYQALNNGWHPPEGFGPKAAIKIVKSYRNRAKDAGETKAKDKAKGPTKAELIKALARRTEQLRQSLDVGRKYAEEAHIEPVPLNAIAHALAEEAAAEGETFPVTAMPTPPGSTPLNATANSPTTLAMAHIGAEASTPPEAAPNKRRSYYPEGAETVVMPGARPETGPQPAPQGEAQAAPRAPESGPRASAGRAGEATGPQPIPAVPAGISTALGVVEPARGTAAATPTKADRRKGPRALAPDRRNKHGNLIKHQDESQRAFKARMAADHVARGLGKAAE